jgi:hypothetical protein
LHQTTTCDLDSRADMSKNQAVRIPRLGVASVAAAIAGLLRSMLLNVNVVPAPGIAKERGIMVEVIDGSCRRARRHLPASNRPGNCVRCSRLPAADLAREHQKCASSPSSSP